MNVLWICILGLVFCSEKDFVTNFRTMKIQGEAPIDVKSGFKGSLTKAGLEYMVTQMSIEVKKNLTTFEYEYDGDVYQKIDTPIGACEFNITEVKISQVKFDHFAVGLLENKVSIVVAAAGGRSDFHYWVKAPVGTSSGNGDVEFQADFSATVGITEDGAKHFEATVEDVKLVISKLDINLKDAKWWLKGIITFLKGTIIEQLQKYVDEQLPAILIQTVDDFLNNNDWIVPIPSMENLAVDYQIDDVVLSLAKGYLGIGDVLELLCQTAEPYHKTHSPTDLPDFYGADKMMQGSVDQFVVNSALYSLHNCGFLKFSLDKSTELPAWGFNLTTQSFKDENIIPELFEKYGSKDLAVVLSSVSSPEIAVSATGIEVTADFDFEIQVVMDKDTVETAVKFESAGKFQGSFAFKENTVTFNLVFDTMKNTLLDHTIEFDFAKFDGWLQTTLLKADIIPYLNDIGATGLEIPFLSDYGITLKDSALENMAGYLKFTTNAVIDPTKTVSRYFSMKDVINRLVYYELFY